MRSDALSCAHPQVGVELVQHQAHGARQVADVRRLLVQSVLEHLKVLHPLHREAVVNDVGLTTTTTTTRTSEQRADETGGGSRQEVTSLCSWRR